jgi:hypothetical protein
MPRVDPVSNHYGRFVVEAQGPTGRQAAKIAANAAFAALGNVGSQGISQFKPHDPLPRSRNTTVVGQAPGPTAVDLGG